jgi:hypothetical protein
MIIPSARGPLLVLDSLAQAQILIVDSQDAYVRYLASLCLAGGCAVAMGASAGGQCQVNRGRSKRASPALSEGTKPGTRAPTRFPCCVEGSLTACCVTGGRSGRPVRCCTSHRPSYAPGTKWPRQQGAGAANGLLPLLPSRAPRISRATRPILFRYT